MSWSKHAVEYHHPDGKITTMYMQTDGRQYVLSEHPENKGPHVSTVATHYGDEVARNNRDVDPRNRPENIQLYAERQDGRFDQWEAKTTRNENISQQPNRYESRAAEWQWRNSHQTEHKDLERKLGTKLEQGHTRFQDRPIEEQNRQFAEASMPRTAESEQLRQSAHEAQRRQHQR